MQTFAAESQKEHNYYITAMDVCSVFQAELAEHIPVIKTSVSGTRLVGRMTVGKLSVQ